MEEEEKIFVEKQQKFNKINLRRSIKKHLFIEQNTVIMC